jgi:ribokinase
MPKLPKKPVYDMISIGDAMFDTFIGLEEASVQCNLQMEKCLLCLSYADKIPAESVQREVGGNAANNAVGSSRLGLKTSIYSIVGGDAPGKMMTDKFRHERVSTEYVQVDKKSETNCSTILNYKTERTILVYHVDRKYKLPKLKLSSWIYFSSVGKNHEKLQDEIVAHIKKTGIRLGFNPGTHQLKRGLQKLKPLLGVTDVLFLNKEEAQRLVGDISDIKELLSATQRTGPKIAVITDGEKGAYAYDGKDYLFCGTTGTPVIERTGAGDSFATAFIAALQHGKDVSEALRWGTVNSASVIAKVAPQAGLLTKLQIAAWLKKFSWIEAKKL